MNEEYKNIIKKNFVALIKNCNVKVLRQSMLNKRVFNENELNKIFASEHDRHNKRVFFFELQKKSGGWASFLDALHETNQSHIVNSLFKKGTTVYREADNTEDILGECDLKSLPIDPCTTPLKVNVKTSDKFYDTFTNNDAIAFYITRSKKRGRALIINNYKFKGKEYRSGAEVDSSNLISMFDQMGGWDIQFHQDKTASEMEEILKKFSEDEQNYLYDICFVIIMSHGDENNNDTVIFGSDETYLSVSFIQTLFSNLKCPSWRKKPKIMLFPVCRGGHMDYPVNSQSTTHFDSIARSPSSTNTPCTPTLRGEEDMLVGYSTLLGFRSHRDTLRGAWYIEILCSVFMKHAYHYSIDALLMMIDQELRERLSDKYSMQTAEFRNKGFKRLYLHPGIYCENGELKRYHDEWQQ